MSSKSYSEQMEEVEERSKRMIQSIKENTQEKIDALIAEIKEEEEEKINAITEIVTDLKKSASRIDECTTFRDEYCERGYFKEMKQTFDDTVTDDESSDDEPECGHNGCVKECKDESCYCDEHKCKRCSSERLGMFDHCSDCRCNAYGCNKPRYKYVAISGELGYLSLL